jgi:hypothetical protein
MITGWILVVLQSTAPYVYGWQPVGDFAYKQECDQAIVQLQNVAKKQKGITVLEYVCVPKSRSAS